MAEAGRSTSSNDDNTNEPVTKKLKSALKSSKKSPNTGRKKLPNQANLWGKFPEFHTDSGSWRPFNIKVQPCHIARILGRPTLDLLY